jgi:hypothetical protein
LAGRFAAKIKFAHANHGNGKPTSIHLIPPVPIDSRMTNNKSHEPELKDKKRLTFEHKLSKSAGKTDYTLYNMTQDRI